MIDAEFINIEELTQQLSYLALPDNRKKQLHRWLGAKIATKSRQRIKQQKDVHGNSFTPRKSKKGKKPLLRKIAKTRLLKPVNVTATGADITWPKNKAGMVARIQQEGQTVKISANNLTNTGNGDAPCSRTQARKLNSLGFRLRAKGKKKRVSVKWIMNNMSAAQAGLIITAMGGRKGKSSWEINTPARPFLGASQADQRQIARELLTKMTEKLRGK